MNGSEIMLALRARFAAPEFAFFSELSSGTGTHHRRTADAVAMNTWPSRGLEFIGFEIKVHRSDWLRELEQPEKAEEIASRCDRWYVVVSDDGIVRPGELPPTWGLMVPRGKGLVVTKEAPKLEPKEWGRPFVAALLRRAATSSATATDLATAELAGYEKGHFAGVEETKRDRDYNQKEFEELRERVAEFDAATGLSFRYLYNIKTKGAGIKAFLDASPAVLLGGLVGNRNILTRLAERTTEAIQALEQQVASTGTKTEDLVQENE